MLRKILLIILFLVVAIGLAVLLYFLFFRPAVKAPVTAPPTTTPISKLPVTKDQWEKMTIEQRSKANLPLYQWPTVETPTVAPTAQPQAPQFSDVAMGGKTWINPVSSDTTQDVTLSIDGRNSLFYNPSDGKFYQIDKDGNKIALSNQVFYNVDKVEWASTKDKAIIEYPDGFKIMYDFKNQKQYSIPNNWQDFSWDPLGQQIAFKATSQYPENNWLAVAQADGTNATPIEHMGDNADKVTVSWSPNNQIIAFSATGQPRGEWQQEILLIGQHSENFKSLVIDGRGFEPQWNPRGDSIAYSVYSVDSSYKPTLYLVKAAGDEIGSNKINTGLNTWSHKCAFNNGGSALYCAVPRDLPTGSGLVPELATNLKDDFYKIDTTTGEVSFLAEGAMGAYDVGQIFVSSDDSTLYFVDYDTGRLRYLKLK